MTNDLFLSMFSRNDLADIYSDYYRDIYGVRPTIQPETNRAGLVDLIEELDLAVQNDPSLFETEDLEL